MVVTGDSIVYSASDLAAARCEYALLRDFDAKLGWGPAAAIEDDSFARTVLHQPAVTDYQSQPALHYKHKLGWPVRPRS